MKKNNEKEAIKEQLDSALASLTIEASEPVEETVQEKLPVTAIEMMDGERLKIENQEYTVVLNHKDGFDAQRLGERYNSILSKYDYIVGDWGYDQLRLSGFYRDSHSKAPFEKKIGFLEDFLYEFCNFGCAYFVLEKQKDGKEKPAKSKRRRRAPRKENTNEAAVKQEQPVANAARPAPRPKKKRDDRRKPSEGPVQSKQFSIKEETGEQSKPRPQTQNPEKKPSRPKRSFKIREKE